MIAGRCVVAMGITDARLASQRSSRTADLSSSDLEPSMRHRCESGLRENRTSRLGGGTEASPAGRLLRPDSGEAGEQGSASNCGVGGAKAHDQREFARPKHGPDAESGNRDTGGRADTAIRKERTAGETHCAAAPRHAGSTASSLLCTEAGGGPGRGRDDVAGVRDGTGCALARTCTDVYTRERTERHRYGGST